MTSEIRMEVPAGRGLPAMVPGDVHLDLMRAGLIKDPMIGDGVESLRWIGERAWWFRRRFQAELGRAARHDLVMDGLCYLADIWLNGVYLGRHLNMHRPFGADVSACLRSDNVLDVRLMAFLPGAEKLPAMGWGAQYNAAVADGYAENRGWMRKAAYSFGWDWAQALPLCGIWRDVRLLSVPLAILDDVFVRARADGRVAVSWSTRGTAAAGKARIEVAISEINRHRTVSELVQSFPLRAGEIRGTVRGRVEKPALWWPAGMGGQPLYRASLVLRQGPDVLDRKDVTFGFRDVRISEPKLSADRGAFRFVVNGEPVYAQGANWIPPDIIPARVPDERYRRLTDLALEAGLNYLRFWGGGIYERPIFYELCDQKGLMLWHDMMFGNHEHPDFDPAFKAECRREVEWAVTALRNHPSIVIWCGSNETDQVCGKLKNIRPGGKYFGERLLHEAFPAWIKTLDPTRAYRPSSGCRGRHSPPGDPPTNPRHGVSHTVYPDPFATDEPLDELTASFVNEWYAGSPPLDGSLRKFLKPAERKWRHPTLELHNFLTVMIDRGVFEQIAGYLFPGDPAKLPFKELCEWFRVWHAEMMTRCIEHYRRQMWRCGGNAVWMFNSAYTALDWSLVDYYLVPKPAFYAAKRANRPVLPVIGRYRDRLDIYVVNNTCQAWPGTLEMSLCAFDGAVLHRERRMIVAGANRSQRFLYMPYSRIPAFDPTGCFVKAVLTPSDGRPPVVNHRFLAKYKHLKLPTASVRARPVAGRLGAFRLTTDILARWVALAPCDAHRRPDDNFFDLLPGEEKIVAFNAPLPARALRVSWSNRADMAELVCCGTEPALDVITPGTPLPATLEFYNPARRPAHRRLTANLPPGFTLTGPGRFSVRGGDTQRVAITLHADPIAIPPGLYDTCLRVGRSVPARSIRVRPAFRILPDGELRFENATGTALAGGEFTLRYLTLRGRRVEQRTRIAEFPPGPFRHRFAVAADVAPYSGELLVNGHRGGTCWLGNGDGAAFWRRLPRRPFDARRLAAFQTTHDTVPDLMNEGHGWLIDAACRDESVTRTGNSTAAWLIFLHYTRWRVIVTLCRPGAPDHQADDRLELALATSPARRDFEVDVLPGGDTPRVRVRVCRNRTVDAIDYHADLSVLAAPGFRLYRYGVPWKTFGSGAPSRLRLAMVIWDGSRNYVRVFGGIHVEKNPAHYGDVSLT